jgi:hypothetical protein
LIPEGAVEDVMRTYPVFPPKPLHSRSFQVLLVFVLGAPCAILFILLCLLVPVELVYGQRVSTGEIAGVLLGLPLTGAGMLYGAGQVRHWLYLLPFVFYALSVVGLECVLPPWQTKLPPSFLFAAIPAFIAAEIIRRFYAHKGRERSGE